MANPTALEPLANPIPLRVWMGESARPRCAALLGERLPEAELGPLPLGAAAGPAIMVLDAEDLAGQRRAQLRVLAEQARPGRPVVLAGACGKELLLDAINTWHAVEVVAHSAVGERLVGAIREAFRALELDQRVPQEVQLLGDECRRLRQATEELRMTQERLLHAERLAVVGRTVGALLLRMRSQFEELDCLRRATTDVPSSGGLRELFDSAVSGIDSLGALLEDMLALSESREAHSDTQLVSIVSLAERAVRFFGHDRLSRERNIQLEPESSALVQVDPCRLLHVLLNLLRNAAEATHPHDRITVRTRAEGDWAVIEIEDRGHGMSPATLERLYSAFFTTKGRAGMGLGLRLARATVESQGGRIECKSARGEGTAFTLRLPVAG